MMLLLPALITISLATDSTAGLYLPAPVSALLDPTPNHEQQSAASVLNATCGETPDEGACLLANHATTVLNARSPKRDNDGDLDDDGELDGYLNVAIVNAIVDTDAPRKGSDDQQRHDATRPTRFINTRSPKKDKDDDDDDDKYKPKMTAAQEMATVQAQYEANRAKSQNFWVDDAKTAQKNYDAMKEEERHDEAVAAAREKSKTGFWVEDEQMSEDLERERKEEEMEAAPDKARFRGVDWRA